MPGLALVSLILCAILQRYRKMQQCSIPVPVERDRRNDLPKAPHSQVDSPVYR
jgi:hypothetical protein